ncbi:S-adenosyl-L-methionine-dependent methyltransferase [Glarea lozoyensis ATCC 20868]|uniref:tRNA (adenine(58)-N(1))-methyltransferase catalytic subunit TRM61 n=1 Tax=Glarea lozoyensis (strain ATCC 20868 / MF5171) TaxID=1116229 RepID=S3DN03_GLAL2|nr:S-adenosyl-L-methionine-dependent methyltransferase [Glarea lozoyensis ATCC 20868]EPE33476.1 S-adenosyl-L-methionine-dependent methyltransferase [Glarea lozoyensis ATCC 20868]
MTSQASPFLHPGTVAQKDRLAIIHLKRDLQNPILLKATDEDDEGYAEGKVVNTRFGSFPHTKLIGLPWGSQVRAVKVDTGSRGRRQPKKRKLEASSEDPGHLEKIAKISEQESGRGDGVVKIESPASVDVGTLPKDDAEASPAATGFIHLLPPTPENWTSSLPHRTQVVYTPDYSYVLHRIRARPGTSIIEAGAGSGSFTHASARAVFSGYTKERYESTNGQSVRKHLGKVWSFEFHEQRHEKLQQELKDHGLEGLVEVTHRDVCEDGFLVDGKSPQADSIFLDLPAPWLALPHLARSKPKPNQIDLSAGEVKSEPDTCEAFVSPLNPHCPVHICTFSPCIEQVQRTMSAMRRLGWVDIEMVDLSQRRFEVRRDRIGIDNGNQHGVLSTPSSVDEAVARLKDVEGSFKAFHETGEKAEIRKRDRGNPNSKDKILESLVGRKIYKEGNLVHRAEQELKTHTSYLVFAVLPIEWSEEDEAQARQKWEEKIDLSVTQNPAVEAAVSGTMSKRQQKKAARQTEKDKRAATAVDAEAVVVEGDVASVPVVVSEKESTPGPSDTTMS